MAEKNYLRSGKDRDILEIFSTNLRILMQGEHTVTDLCRKLQINRTQFNRYLSGEASPRVLILARICKYFKVDARILLEPLKDVLAASPIAATSRVFQDLLGGTMGPVSHKILPDGLYAEWKYDFLKPEYVAFHLIQISTKDATRRFRSKAKRAENPIIPGTRSARSVKTYVGIAFEQPNGFAIIDHCINSEIQTYTSFRASSSIHGITYSGMKVAAAPYVPHLTHACSPCILEALPGRTGAILKAARTPQLQPVTQVPPHIRRLLGEISNSMAVSAKTPG